VIGQLLAAPPGKGELAGAIAALAECTWHHPISGEPTRFGFSTIERWYYRALKEKRDPVGVLRRKLRADAGLRLAAPDPARLGDALQPRSDIHPVAVDSGFVMDDIALVDTDPELNSARLFDLSIALPHSRLDRDRAFDGVHDTPKLSEDPVACRIDDPATVLPNHREDDCLVRFEITNGGSLVSAMSAL
jgi:hypothetical protein